MEMIGDKYKVKRDIDEYCFHLNENDVLVEQKCHFEDEEFNILVHETCGYHVCEVNSSWAKKNLEKMDVV